MTRVTRNSVKNVGGASLDDSVFRLDVPTLRPTFHEFRDFYGYIRSIEEKGEVDLSLVKVIPPKEWSWKMKPNAFVDNPAEHSRHIRPITQYVGGKKGAFHLDLIESARRSVKDFMKIAQDYDARRPSLARVYGDDGGPILSGTFSDYHPDVKSESLSSVRWKGKVSGSSKDKNKNPGNNSDEFSFNYSVLKEFNMELDCFCFVCEGTYTDTDCQVVSDTMRLYHIPFLIDEKNGKIHLEGYGICDRGTYRASGEFEGPTSEGGEVRMIVQRKFDKLETSSEDQVQSFDYAKAKEEINLRDFMVLDRSFWTSMNHVIKPPMYGGDQNGTLFRKNSADGWNLNQLNSLLRKGFGEKQAPGISTSMLYFGMWRAMFAWHTEDMELNSINFLHFGAPKIWYCVPHEYARRFEEFVSVECQNTGKKCPNFLRHKNVMISPARLERHGIPYIRAIQHPGEFMLTFPRSYHGGFNAGFNVAEAVNFATQRWVDFGRRARWCTCENWTFRMDVDDFVDCIRKRWPDMLPKYPVVGDLVWIDCEDVSAANRRKLVNSRWNLFRLRKGTATCSMVAVPTVKGDRGTFRIPFSPSVNNWKWPHEYNKETMDQSLPEESSAVQTESCIAYQDSSAVKRESCIAHQENPAVQKESCITVQESIYSDEETPCHLGRLQRFSRLNGTRRKRLLDARARMFARVCSNPELLIKISLAPALATERAENCSETATSSVLPQKRVRKLEQLAKTRSTRRNLCKKRVYADTVAKETLGQVVSEICNER